MAIQRLLKEPISTTQLLENLRGRLEDVDSKTMYLKQNKPETVSEKIEQAEYAYHGMMKLPGTGGVKEFIGDPPCWLERRHNDNEFLWQLNRMTHWQDLLEGYSLTRDERYARKVIDEMMNWIAVVDVPENLADYPIGYFSACNPNRALELGIRNYKTWPLVLEHLGKTRYFTEEVLENYLEVVYRQIKALRKVSPLLWPKADHNHFLMECLGILTTALYFPELKEADEWRTFAVDGIERCGTAQMTEDGGQIEGCPSYHNGCMFWFGMAMILAKRFGFQFSVEFETLYRRNLDYSIYSLRPTGKCIPAGDSHANHLASMAGIYGYLALDDLSWLELASGLIDFEQIQKEADKHAWRAPDMKKFYESIDTLKDHHVICNMKTVFGNLKLGQAIIRSDWSRGALSLFMTCRSPIQNAHAHIDLLSFEFTALGKNMICDPGIFCYRDDEDRREFKSTAYHSTIVMDDKNQFEYLSSFQFGPQKEGRMINVEERGFYSIASGYHCNYEPVIHQRHMALVDQKFAIVADRLTGLEKNQVKRYFHMDYTDVEIQKDVVLAKDKKANLAIYTSVPQHASLLPGRLSDINDIARLSTRLVYEGVYSGEQIFVTILIPYQGEMKEEAEVKEISGHLGEYEIRFGQKYRIAVENNDMKIWKL